MMADANGSKGKYENAKISWTQAKVIQLIKMYWDHPTLWNSKLPTYKDCITRHDNSMELAEHFSLLKEEIERKIKNL